MLITISRDSAVAILWTQCLHDVVSAIKRVRCTVGGRTDLVKCHTERKAALQGLGHSADLQDLTASSRAHTN